MCAGRKPISLVTEAGGRRVFICRVEDLKFHMRREVFRHRLVLHTHSHPSQTRPPEQFQGSQYTQAAYSDLQRHPSAILYNYFVTCKVLSTYLQGSPVPDIGYNNLLRGDQDVFWHWRLLAGVPYCYYFCFLFLLLVFLSKIQPRVSFSTFTALTSHFTMSRSRKSSRVAPTSVSEL
jgi:hypothetical protein